MHIAVDTHTFGCLKAAFLLLVEPLLSTTPLTRRTTKRDYDDGAQDQQGFSEGREG